LPAKILLLSGYDAASHRHWRELLKEKLAHFEWTQLALPGRNFSWRMRGSSLSFAFGHQEELEQKYDLLLVTSMVDLAGLRGFVPALAQVPTLIYFHENQFVYPVSKQQPNLVNAQLTSIYSALCADRIVFNSRYNQQSFLSGAESLLKRLPDQVPAGLVLQLAQKSSVLPVPIRAVSALEREQQKVVNNKPRPAIVWNHRWEYDKQPEVFFTALSQLKKAGVDFSLSVVGESFRNSPACFAEAERDFKDHIDDFGYQSAERYRAILTNSDIAVSSALHDFQGLSLQEAISAGSLPVAPDRVAYPEYVPERYRYAVSDDPVVEADNLYRKLHQIINESAIPKRGSIEVNAYCQQQLVPRYDQLFKQMIAQHDRKVHRT